MDYESIKADVLKELELLGLPQSEIDRIILDFDDVVTKVSDDPSLMKRLATDLINAAKFRANLKSEVPDTIPEEVIKSTPLQTFETIKKYDVDIVRANPDKLYIFGDNTEGWGKGGQAIIRDEPNAFGISTKNSPSEFMSDNNFEANKARIDADIAAIKADGRPIVFPEDGIGTGRADLQNKAPRTYEYLMGEIEKLKGGDPNKLPKQGGSLGAAKLNDPNVFETFIEEATTDEKKMIKGLDESGKLDDVGGVKGLITDLVTQYPQTAKVIGRSLGAFLQGAATLIDPVGEAIDLGLKLGGKKPVVGGINAIKREGFTWALWQASAFGFTQIQDMGNIVNMTLDKVGLLPDWYKDKVDVPQNMEEINAEYAINTEKNRRLANQGYKATSLWWWLDQGIPSRLTGLSPIEWAIRKWEYNQFGDITDDEKKFLDVMYGYDTRMEKNKESMFGWWQNEFDTNFTKKYYNEAHINDFRKIEKIGPEFGMEGVEIYNDFKELGLIDE